ncbi:hypothetical protein B296_00036954, partial [Ensete ventricosum]
SPRAGTKVARGRRGRLWLAGEDNARYFFSSFSSFFKRLPARGQNSPVGGEVGYGSQARMVRGTSSPLLLLSSNASSHGDKVARGLQGQLRLAGEDGARYFFSSSSSFFKRLPARGQNSPVGGEVGYGSQARTARGTSSSLLLSSFPFLLLPFFFFNRPPTVDFSLNRPLTAEIDRCPSKLIADRRNRPLTAYFIGTA